MGSRCANAGSRRNRARTRATSKRRMGALQRKRGRDREQAVTSSNAPPVLRSVTGEQTGRTQRGGCGSIASNLACMESHGEVSKEYSTFSQLNPALRWQRRWIPHFFLAPLSPSRICSTRRDTGRRPKGPAPPFFVRTLATQGTFSASRSRQEGAYGSSSEKSPQPCSRL